MCDSLNHHDFLRTLTAVWCALGFRLNYESKSQLHNYKGCCKLILVLHAFVIRMLVMNILTLFSQFRISIQHMVINLYDMILQPYYFVVFFKVKAGALSLN